MLQHARLPYPSLSPWICSNSCPLVPSHHLILCCPFLLLLSIFPNIGVFPVSWFFTSGGRTGVSASASVLPMNIQDWFLLVVWLDLLAVQGTLKSILQHHSSKASILRHSRLFTVQLLTSIHDYWKNHSFDYMDHCWQSDVFSFSYTVCLL